MASNLEQIPASLEQNRVSLARIAGMVGTSQGRAKSADVPSALIPEGSNPTIDEVGFALARIADQLTSAAASPGAGNTETVGSVEMQRLDNEMRIRRALVHLKEARTELLHVERALAELALREGFTLRQVGGPLGVSLSTLSKWKAHEQFFTVD